MAQILLVNQVVLGGHCFSGPPCFCLFRLTPEHSPSHAVIRRDVDFQLVGFVYVPYLQAEPQLYSNVCKPSMVFGWQGWLGSHSILGP